MVENEANRGGKRGSLRCLHSLTLRLPAGKRSVECASVITGGTGCCRWCCVRTPVLPRRCCCSRQRWHPAAGFSGATLSGEVGNRFTQRVIQRNQVLLVQRTERGLDVQLVNQGSYNARWTAAVLRYTSVVVASRTSTMVRVPTE